MEIHVHSFNVDVTKQQTRFVLHLYFKRKHRNIVGCASLSNFQCPGVQDVKCLESEYDQVISQAHTADQTTAPRGRDTEQ